MINLDSLSLSDLVNVLSDIEQESNRRRYLAEPDSWIEEVLGETIYSKQREICLSVANNKRTAVASCFSSGKSFIAARIIAGWISNHPPGEAFAITTAPTNPQVKAILWRELGRAHTAGKLPGRMNQAEWYIKIPGGKEEIVAYGRKPSDMKLEEGKDSTIAAFQGIHAKYILVVLDEAAGIPRALFNTADSALIINENSRILAIGNPEDSTSAFADACKPGSGWNFIHIPYSATPNFTGEPVSQRMKDELLSTQWIDEKRVKWGETNPLWISKALAQFPESSSDGLIPIAWIRAAQDRQLAPTAPVELGVDVGGGGDKNVIAHRQGPVVRIIRRDRNPDTMKTLGNVMEAIKTTGATSAKVDNIGIGHGAVDRAKEIADDQTKEQGIRDRAKVIKGVSVGESARDTEAFVNLRAEGYWGVRERFQEGNIDIDSADEDLAAQLVDMQYKRTSSGKIQIESKEEMKRRGKSSPDDADAVMLSFLPVEEKKVYRATWGSRNRR